MIFFFKVVIAVFAGLMLLVWYNEEGKEISNKD